MSSAPRTAYTSGRGVISEGEIAVLASVYQFVLRCGEEKRKKGGPETAPNDAKGSPKHEVRATQKYTS